MKNETPDFGKKGPQYGSWIPYSVVMVSLAAALALVYITFIGSMLIANDMALITFLPLGYFVFSVTDSKRDVAVVFILQNIAANLGGMLTPFGNPQNLYLYAHYHIANGEFVSIMFPPFAVSIALITLCCLLLPKRALRIQASQQGQGMRLPPARTAFYLALFALTILMVFRLLPAWLVLAILIVSLLIADRKALKMVDYCLLLTFGTWRGLRLCAMCFRLYCKETRCSPPCCPASASAMCPRPFCFRSLRRIIPRCWWA